MVLPTDFYAKLIDKMMDAYSLNKIILDQDGMPCDYEFMDLNASFETITGLKREKIIGRKASEIFLNIKKEGQDWIKMLGEVALEGKTFSLDIYSKSFGKWLKVTAYSPQKYYFITIIQDISQLKEITNKLNKLSEQQQDLERELNEQLVELSFQQNKLSEYQKKLHQKTFYDPLTGLPNRSLLHKRMSECCRSGKTNKNTVFYIDLDNIKYINETLGHFFGDKLIIRICDRLSSLLDTNTELFRFGGDEFVILKRNCLNLQETKEFGFRIIQLFRKPFIIENTQLYATVSIGISIYPDHSTNPSELLKFADIAMHQAKKEGKNKYVLFNRLMQHSVHNRMLLEKHLRSALYNNEFSLFYQPLVELKTGKICGFEALLRWHSPHLGNVPPVEFIPVAEDTHLIISIGEWVLRNSCYFLKKLHNLGHTGLTMSINISIIQLLQDDFVEQVLTILDFTQLKPEHLEIELTESIFLESYDSILTKLELLRKKGVKVALDDFGKGYSSLGELIRLPITTLKIDKSFVDTIETDEISRSIISMIIKIGRAMGLTVHAEGVENQEQLDFLARQKCHRVQGYLLGKPLNENEALNIMQGSNDIQNDYAKFIWKNDYNIGIEEIDKQHQKIFDIGNQISKLVFSDVNPLPYKEIQQILVELKNYTVEHFATEEEFMKLHSYVNYQSHKTMHTNFTESILNFEHKDIELTDRYKLIELLDAVFVWITNHILKVDSQLKNILD